MTDAGHDLFFDGPRIFFLRANDVEENKDVMSFL
jgi:hypothetical protein